MEDSQRKQGQRSDAHDAQGNRKARKVRFKLASSYSGRVLKHVYEDGQELESPEEKYPRSFIHKIPQHLEVGQLYGFEDMGDSELYPTTGLTAQRINIYRGVGAQMAPVYRDHPEGADRSPVLDFGKIIIYTSNLRIIRAPRRRGESGKTTLRECVGEEEISQGGEPSTRGKHRPSCDHEKEHSGPDDKDADGSCVQCGGSGCAPCSLCHGSKLSMLANRFNESIRELRCPACNPYGLERCQSCA
ncbi:glutaredoxin domain-containing cysteine-rich protein 2 [Chanos chanos]|uniref:Glutaredoxin domain-containing cysteine-rich protein 2 n=1 Tax=Chanos chanos TaxID=29144 RepID=A0A6J2X0Q2_CHACN|nr:glutaredoxin domain-containing cysteine-rich protein 2 [Chanos chanos]